MPSPAAILASIFAAALLAGSVQAAEPASVAALLEAFAAQNTAKRVPYSGITQVPAVLAAAGVTRLVVDDWGGCADPGMAAAPRQRQGRCACDVRDARRGTRCRSLCR